MINTIFNSKDLYAKSIRVFLTQMSFDDAVKNLKENPDMHYLDIVRRKTGSMCLSLALQALMSPHQNIWQTEKEHLIIKFDENWKENILNLLEEIEYKNENTIYLVDFIFKHKQELFKIYN